MSFDYGAFWEDLIEDLADPEFREAYIDMSLQFMQQFHEDKLAEEREMESYEATHDSWKDCTGRKFLVHKRNVDCDINGCAIHNPSYHPLSDSKQLMREDKGYLIERICSHGVGHPDPDSASFMAKNGYGKGIWIHGCDGCCREPEKPLCYCGCKEGQHMGKPQGCIAHGFHEYAVEKPGKVERGWGPNPFVCPDENDPYHSGWDCNVCNPYGLGPEDIH